MATLEELQKTTEELISFQSTHENPEQLAECAKYIEHFFWETKLKVTRYVFNGVPSVVVTKGTKTPKVLFSGHFDVVPGEPDQFMPYVEGDRLYGRGALDMKGGNAVMMHLMRDLADTDHSIGLMLTGDEEIGGFNGTGQLLKQGYSADVVVIPDGGEAVHRIVRKEKGLMQMKLVAYGLRAHGSRPWKGINAIERMIDALTQVKKQFIPLEEHPEDHWVSTMNIGTIKGGLATNQVPDRSEATIDIRFTENDSADGIIKQITSCLPRGVDAEFQKFGAVTSLPLEHNLVTPFVQSLNENGREVEWEITAGASDSRFFSEQNIPAIISQPDGANLHAPGEWVSLSSMKLYYDILKSYVEKVA